MKARQTQGLCKMEVRDCVAYTPATRVQACRLGLGLGMLYVNEGVTEQCSDSEKHVYRSRRIRNDERVPVSVCVRWYQ